MQNRMEMALAVDVKTDVAADAKTDAAADAEFPAAAAAETAIRGLAVPERPIPAAAAEHRQRTGNAGHTVRDTATAGTGRAGMMLSGAGMAETEIAAEIKTYKNSNCRKSPGIYRDFSAFVTVLT